MDIENLIILLSILSKNPALIRSVNRDELDTEFGKIKKACTDSCIEVILHNNIVESVDIGTDRDYVNELYDMAVSRAREFGIYLLNEKIRLCNETINEMSKPESE